MKSKICFLQLSLAVTLGIPMAAFAQNVFPASGNVGIGTASPSFPLHVKGPGGGYTATVEGTNGINFVGLVSHSGGGNYGSVLQFIDGPTQSGAIACIASGGMRFATAGTERVAIDGSGNVAIGNPPASQPMSLRVYGTNGNWHGGAAFGGPSASVMMGEANNQAWIGGHNGSLGSRADLIINGGGGNVGIGTAAPQAKLDVAGDVRIGGTTLSYAGIGRVFSGQEITVQTGNNAPLYLNPFAGGEVVVGSLGAGDRTLRVAGKVQATTLELTSDVNQKGNIVAIRGADVLDKLVGLRLSTWNFTNSPAVRHIGPMAQDFQAAFQLGEDDKHISVVDGLGVSFAAIQGLNAKVEEAVKAKDREIASLQRQVSDLKQELAAVQNTVADRLAALEQSVSKSAVQQASFRPEASH